MHRADNLAHLCPLSYGPDMNIEINIPEDALVSDVIAALEAIRRSLPWGRPRVRVRLTCDRAMSGAQAVAKFAGW